MSVYYSFYLEANINGNWHCASPEFPELRKELEKDHDALSRFAPLLTGQSMLGSFIDDIDTWNISLNDISEELRNDLYGEDYLSKNPEENDDFFDCSQMYVIPSEELRRIADDAKEPYDMAGLLRIDEAKAIERGEWNGDIYPAYMSDIIEKLAQSVDAKKATTEVIVAACIDKFYVRKEWLQDGGTLYYKKKLVNKINLILDTINDASGFWGDNMITLDKCRVIICIS